jgi:hypothetical protein
MTFLRGSGSGSADPCLSLMDPDPVADADPDPYLRLLDPDLDPGGPKTRGSGSRFGFPTLGSTTLC